MNIFDTINKALTDNETLMVAPLVAKQSKAARKRARIGGYMVKRSGNKALELLRLIHRNPMDLTFKQAATMAGLSCGGAGYRYLIDTGAIEVVREVKIKTSPGRGRSGYAVRLGRIGLEKLIAFNDNGAMPPVV